MHLNTKWPVTTLVLFTPIWYICQGVEYTYKAILNFC